MKKNYKFKSLLLTAFGLASAASFSQTTTFNYTGAMQTYTVPAGVTMLAVEVYGGDGHGDLGFGGLVTADIPVTPGEVLNIFVGGQGTETTGGYNGGGDGGANSGYGGGGGASDIRQGGVAYANRIVVAGGGGGTGSNCGTNTAEGGHGGGLTGGSGCAFSCSDCQYTGSGGTQIGGGVAGPTGHGSCGGNQNGALGVGGTNTIGGYGTGGGGGYYGGGSGCFEGAGGGSSYTFPSATNVVHTQGVQVGNGQILITPLCDGLTTTVSTTTLCLGESFIVTATSTNGGTVTWDNGVTGGVAFTPAATGLVTYTATSTNVADCDFSVDIEVFDLPTVTAGVDLTEICLGESVTFIGSGTADTYVWDNGVTDGAVFTPAAAGTITYTVTGTNTTTTCENTSTVDVTVFDVISITVNATDEMFGSDGAIDITVAGGDPAYTYDWDIDGTGDFDDTEDLTSLDPGTYIIVVEDASSCASATETIVIGSQLSVSENENMNLTVYPNPTADQVTIEFAGQFTYVLTSVNGDMIYSGNATDKGIVSMSELAAGIYFIVVNGTDKIQVVKN